MGQKSSCRRAGLAAFALFAAAAPGHAQSLAATKSDAIIGAPSQLAAIMAAQSTGIAVALATPYRPVFVSSPALYTAPPSSRRAGLARR